MPLVADEPLYEVVDGWRVELAPMGVHETLIASALMFFLQMVAKPQGLGRAVVEALFDLEAGGRGAPPAEAPGVSPRGPPNRRRPPPAPARPEPPTAALQVG